MKNKNNEWINDYEVFLSVEQVDVPVEVSDVVFSSIQKLLHPRAVTVFFKILGVHLVTGFLSLSFCHQFGFNPFNTEYSLAEWFMSTGGYYACMIGCGVTFVSLSVLMAGYFLSVEEVKALKRTDLIQNFALGVISLGLFTTFGVEFILSVAGLWMLGSLVGGFVAMSAVFKLKTFRY